MTTGDETERYAEAIRKLLLVPERSSIQQGISLAIGLDDARVFDLLLGGVTAPAVDDTAMTKYERYPTPRWSLLADASRTDRPWLELALVHLLAASDHPLRGQVTSVTLGRPGVPVDVWIDGFERLDSLKYLDLHLPGPLDPELLRRLPNLTHLRIRGTREPQAIPAMPNLEVLEGGNLELDTADRWPALRTLAGRVHALPALTAEMAPALERLDIRKDLRVEGIEHLEMVRLQGGPVELHGCRSIAHLEPNAPSMVVPDLVRVGTLRGTCPGIEVSRLESLDEVRLLGTGRFTGGTFPSGTRLLDSSVFVWGPSFTDIGNLGELEGLESLTMSRVLKPTSLETLRHAKQLRVLDIRTSTGITDLTPLIGLPALEVIVTNGSGVTEIPDEIAHLVSTARKTKPRPTAVETSEDQTGI